AARGADEGRARRSGRTDRRRTAPVRRCWSKKASRIDGGPAARPTAAAGFFLPGRGARARPGAFPPDRPSTRRRPPPAEPAQRRGLLGATGPPPQPGAAASKCPSKSKATQAEAAAQGRAPAEPASTALVAVPARRPPPN